MLKKIVHNSINSLLLVPFIMVLSTVFIVSKDLANGIVAGKYFWFYLSMMLISVNIMVSFCMNRKKVVFSILDILIGIFCVSGVVITYIHNESISNKSVILLLVLLLYFYFKVFIVQYRWNAFILIIVFVSTGFVEAIWGLKQLYGFSSSQHSLFKTTGSFFNPGPYAGYLAMIMPLAFYYILNDYRIFKNKFQYTHIPFYCRGGISLLSFCSILLVLPATMSRASWIAAVTGCLIAGILYLMKNRKLKIYIKRFRNHILFILLGIVALSMVGLAGIYYLKKDSADGRAFIWKTSIQVIKEHPLGVGLGNFPGVYGEKQAEYFGTQQGSEQEQLVAGNPEYAFNEYVQVCVESGIIPFFLFISIIICIVYTAVRKKRYAPLGAFSSILVFAAMSYPFSILPFLISFVFLIALCLPDNLAKNYAYSPKLSVTIIFIVALFFITTFSIYNRYPSYDAYKRWNKSKTLYGVGLYKDVNKEYAKIYPYLDHEVEFLFEYAQSLSRSEYYEESNRILEKAIRISCDPMLYNITGKNHQAVGNYALAEQYFNKAAMIVPSRLYPYYLLAKLYDEMGDKEKVCQMAGFIRSKEAKVHSTAVDEMREEMRSLCEKYKTK
ncbi:O-antigen ligase family protein [uncultured Proteiniphilum sp.]|uniref:O-antigen ligase family protein n=1 Tax=uncultured Proteiniphilum sp. TaxID=497637 RepID=UPI002630741F|nr:O-antigen ligase family protein [uncultured Proteiniphilum sp.]